ncbi:MAG: hypothetical protein LAC70_06775 [Methylovulum sp.]|jgi:hypothetical protein|nr:hypothetical protein [Methylovulum sp.]
MSAISDEIWVILREIAKERKEFAEEFAKERKEFAEEFARERKESARERKESARERKEFSEEFAKKHQEIAKEQQENSRQIAGLRASQQETIETLKRVGVDFGCMKKNQGDITEEFFFNSLLDDPHLGDIYFDDITKSQFKHRGNVQEEYDIVMTNGTAIGIIEVKYKAHEKDVDKLERKMKNFKTLFPVYEHYKLYGAMASFHFYDAAKEDALARGFFVLQRSGKVVQTNHGETLWVL